MAAPIDSFVQLADDSAYTSGKKVRSQTRVVGSNTVHEHFYTTWATRIGSGVYGFSTGILTPPSSADNGTSTGQFWLVNPPGYSMKVFVRSIKYSMVLRNIGTTADNTVQRLAFALFTCTGYPTGAVLAYARRDSGAGAVAGSQFAGDAMPASLAVTASTGLTVTLGNLFRADLFPTQTAATGIGNTTPYISPERSVVGPDRLGALEEQIVLRSGEGLVCYVPDAGTASTDRRFLVSMIIEEA